MADHYCLEHLVYRQHEWVETHGLDCGPYERGWEEWWECVICGEKFTGKELDAMTDERQEAAIDFIGNAELEAERADHVGLSEDAPEAEQ